MIVSTCSLLLRGTSAALRQEKPLIGLFRFAQPPLNVDGSVDIYIGPSPPAGKEANWIPTASGRSWFPFFRFYGPEKPLFDKTWKLPDIEHVH